MGPSATISSTLSSALRISSASLSSKAIEEGSMDGEHLIVTCTLSNCEKKIRTHALIDTGATGFSFIDENFASHHHLPLLPLKNPRKLEVIDGRL